MARFWGCGAILLTFIVLLSAQNSTEQLREEVPVHLPYDEVANYSYPYLIPPPPEQIIWLEQQRHEWIKWWKEFDGGGEDSGGDANNTPKVYVVWVVKPMEPNIYWKDKTYDTYSGWNWDNSGNGSYSSLHGNSSVEFQIFRVLNGGNYTIQMIEPATSGSAIRMDTFRILNGSANYSISNDSYSDYLLKINATPNTTITYNVTFYPVDYIDERNVKRLNETVFPAEVIKQNLQLPENIDPQLKELAKNLTDLNLSLLQQIEKDRDWVHGWIEYDLYWASGENIPVGTEMANWTFTHRKGICSHYATLYVVIARLQGIPTRIATGFAGGYAYENATWIFPVFGHAWAESYIPPYGWIPVDPTGNVTERANESTGEKKNVSVEWSDAGKVTIDLQFTLNKTLEQKLIEKIEQEIKEEMRRNGTLNESKNMTEQEMLEMDKQIQRLTEFRMRRFMEFLANLSRQDFRAPWNFTEMNWSDWSENFTPWNFTGNFSNWTWQNYSYNNTYNWSGYNYSDVPYNKTWNWSSNYTERGNWSQFNQTWNYTKLKEIYQNRTNTSAFNESISDEGRKKDLLDGAVQQNETFLKVIHGVTSQVGEMWTFALAVLLGIATVALLLYAKNIFRRKDVEAKEKRIKDLFRKVNIEEVIRRYKQLGEENRFDEAVVYGYNELADYISFVFKILNDPSKTAREFADLFITKNVDVGSLKTITFIFEKTRYAKKTTKEDYFEFLKALMQLAKHGG